MRIIETQFVELLRRQAGRHARGLGKLSGLRRGIGDDCAVIAYSREKDLLITTDLFLEGVHFRRDWQEPRSVGHKALARALSDIAAMGGTPRYAFLSLGLPAGSESDWVNALLRGFFRLAAAEKVVLAGGDTGASKSGFVADVIVVGEVPRQRSILRSGARPGDEIWVTGRLGLAALALRALEEKNKKPIRAATVSERFRYVRGTLDERKKESSYADALQAFFYPQPRLHIGRFLRERKLASAMIDLSDGLSLDLARLCKESGAGARIFESSIPRTPQTPIRDALHGGEDLELIFTVPPGRSHALPSSIAGVKLTRIGHIIPGKKLLLVRGDKDRPLPVLGFQHF